MANKYQWAVSLPRVLSDRVRALPLEELGFRSPTEFARVALAEKCDELEARVARGRAR